MFHEFKSYLKIFYDCVIVKGALSGLKQILAIESLWKWWKMLFISPQKLCSFSRYLSFCLDLLVM